MNLMKINDAVTFDDLIRAYLRFKGWMDYDIEHSAYSAKEIIVMQALFGTAYIKVPSSLAAASYEELLTFMEKRQVALGMLTEVVHTSGNEDDMHNILSDLEKYSFKSEVHYLNAGFEVIMQTAFGACHNDVQELGVSGLEDEFLVDHFEETDEATYEVIKAFIIGEQA